MRKIQNRTLNTMGFLQAFTLLIYIILISSIMTNGQNWFGKMPNYLGPILILTLFTTSALISGLITLYFPFILFYYKKQTVQAINLVFYTARWLVLFAAIIIIVLILTK